jgi:Flp pilus assembly protein TadD
MRWIRDVGVLFCVAVLAAWGQTTTIYEQGRAAFSAHRYADAVTLFVQAEKADMGHSDALLFEGKALANLGRFAEADAALRQFLAQQPDSADALYMLGYVLHRENNPRESLSTYTQAARLIAPQSDDLKIVGLDYVLLDDYPDAIRWLEKAVEFDPKNREAWYSLGRCHYTQSGFSDAERAFQRALALKPEDEKIATNLGLVYEMENRIEDADRTYKQSVALAEKDLQSNEWPYMNYASFLLEHDRSAEAVPLLEQSIKVAPRCSDCHAKLGRALAANGKPVEAITELQQAVALSPQDPKMHYELGHAYRAAGWMDKAKEELALSAKLYGSRASERAK